MSSEPYQKLHDVDLAAVPTVCLAVQSLGGYVGKLLNCFCSFVATYCQLCTSMQGCGCAGNQRSSSVSGRYLRCGQNTRNVDKSSAFPHNMVQNILWPIPYYFTVLNKFSVLALTLQASLGQDNKPEPNLDSLLRIQKDQPSPEGSKVGSTVRLWGPRLLAATV